MVHQAFNYLYLMNDDLRLEMAIKILICNKALDAVKMPEGGNNTAQKLIRSIFDKPLAYLRERTSFVFAPPPKALSGRGGFSWNIETAQNAEETQKDSDLPKLTPAQPAEAERPSTNGIQTSEESGMKVVRLKRTMEVKMG
jgi:hypothetical protein